MVSSFGITRCFGTRDASRIGVSLSAPHSANGVGINAFYFKRAHAWAIVRASGRDESAVAAGAIELGIVFLFEEGYHSSATGDVTEIARYFLASWEVAATNEYSIPFSPAQLFLGLMDSTSFE